MALGAAAVDLAGHRLGVHRLADILGAGQLDDLDQAKVDVDVDHRAVRRERVLDVRGALASLRVERLGRPVPPLHSLVDHRTAQQVRE